MECDKFSQLKPISEEQQHYFKLTKGLGKFPSSSSSSTTTLTLENFKVPAWNLLKEDVSLPAAVLSIPNYEHNLHWMQNYVNHYGFHLAPHGKTSMCPKLFQKQIQNGCWGMTLATAAQVHAAHSFGISQVLMANQLVGKVNMELISSILDKDPQFRFVCIVDSADNVRTLGQFFKSRNQTLRILLEMGVEGGRTGLRNNAEEELVISEIRKWTGSLKLVGVEFFEGVLAVEDPVRKLVQRAIQRTQELAKLTAFDEFTVILSGSGSAWFDVVAEEFSKVPPLKAPYKLEFVLRSGCYLTHSVKIYDQIQERLTIQNPIDGVGLKPALTVWAYVQAVPEYPNNIIVGMGKRDVLDDCGFPVPVMHFRPQAADDDDNKSYKIDKNPTKIEDGLGQKWTITRMMDQHSFMSVNDGSDIKVGDIVIFNICHPCTTFDKWRHVLAVDENYIVQDIFDTYF